MPGTEPEPVVFGTDPAVFNEAWTAPSPGGRRGKPMPGTEPEPVVFDTDPAVCNDARTAPPPGETQGEADARY